jgi:hypothetical protein
MAQMNSLQALRVAVRLLQENLEKAQYARDHLRQQSNELKGLALVLVRKLKLAAAEALVDPEDDAPPSVEEQRRYSDTQREPIRILKADWEAATSGPEAMEGKGVVLLVTPQENGDVLVDLGDVEKEDPQPKAEA